eukprot:COSAG03_NODE_675_length_6358_cov_51.683016_3_plen_350_part_00
MGVPRSVGSVLLLLAASAGLLHVPPAVAELNASNAEMLWAPCDLESAGEQPVEYLLLRKELSLAQPAVQVASAILEVTALQSDEKILSAYKLWVNGKPVSNGPGRNAHCAEHLQAGDDWRSWHCNQTTQGYDTVNITEAIRSDGGNATAVLAFQAWAWAGGAPPRGHRSEGGLMALLTLQFSDGSTQTVATTPGNLTATESEANSGSPWMAFNATPAFNPVRYQSLTRRLICCAVCLLSPTPFCFKKSEAHQIVAVACGLSKGWQCRWDVLSAFRKYCHVPVACWLAPSRLCNGRRSRVASGSQVLRTHAFSVHPEGGRCDCAALPSRSCFGACAGERLWLRLSSGYGS